MLAVLDATIAALAEAPALAPMRVLLASLREDVASGRTFDLDRCPGCGAATHASESDDAGRCAECAAHQGEPHAAAEGKA